MHLRIVWVSTGLKGQYHNTRAQTVRQTDSRRPSQRESRACTEWRTESPLPRARAHTRRRANPLIHRLYNILQVVISIFCTGPDLDCISDRLYFWNFNSLYTRILCDCNNVFMHSYVQLYMYDWGSRIPFQDRFQEVHLQSRITSYSLKITSSIVNCLLFFLELPLPCRSVRERPSVPQLPNPNLLSFFSALALPFLFVFQSSTSSGIDSLFNTHFPSPLLDQASHLQRHLHPGILWEEAGRRHFREDYCWTRTGRRPVGCVWCSAHWFEDRWENKTTRGRGELDWQGWE